MSENEKMIFVVFDVPLVPLLCVIALFFEANVNVKRPVVVVAEKPQPPAKNDHTVEFAVNLVVSVCMSIFCALLMWKAWNDEFVTRAKRLNDLFCIGLCLVASFGMTALMSFILIMH